MKTKIIYISGNEVFEMSEIRAAFDEVRAALGLDNDTILFGVPVDSDNALADTPTQTQNVIVASNIPQREIIEEESQDVIETTIVDTIEETPAVNQEEFIVAPEQPTPLIEDVIEDCPVPVNTAESDTTENDEKKVIPILSVLGMQQQNPFSQQSELNKAEQEIDASEDFVVTSDTPQEASAETQVIEPIVDDTTCDTEIERVAIGDMIDEEAPVAPMEKTLEQLLESMTPLREDTIVNNIEDEVDEAVMLDENDTDATLAQLASEFAENEDKITAPQKPETHGKIGKLKNILPFKKAKRDDGGLMGDLFGWAGIAANDEDFSIPGFFANAKKQGA